MSFSKAVNLSATHFLRKHWYTIPSVSVSSVEEYFALPKKDREYYGLYRSPFALPWERVTQTGEMGWDSFYSKIKQDYPLQYFVREWLFSTDNPVTYAYYRWIYWPFRDAKYSIKRWLKPLHPRWRASLPRHEYCDISELIVTSNFALIRDFYWEETINSNFVNWESDPAHKEFYTQLKTYVHWIEKKLPELDKLHSDFLDIASSTIGGNYQEKYKECIQIEKEKEDKMTEILTWFITNRGFFWT